MVALRKRARLHRAATHLLVAGAVCVTAGLAGCASSGALEQRQRELGAALAAPPPPVAVGDATAEVFAERDTLDRAELVELVLSRNPELHAAQSGVRAALAEVPRVRSLDDPMVSYGIAPLSIAEGGPRFGHSIEVRQALPYPGKLRLKGEMALAAAQADLYDFEALRRELAEAASVLFDDWYFVHRADAINREHQQLLREAHRIAVARYSAGKAPQQEPLATEVEQAHLDHRALQLHADRLVTRARINALLHRDSDAPLPPPPAALPDPTAAFDAEGLLLREALQSRPELRAARARVEAGEAAVELAEKDGRPDFGVMAQYNNMWAEVEHQWMVGLSFNLPLRRGAREGLRDRERARLHGAEYDLQAETDRVRLQVKEHGVRLSELGHIVRLFREQLLPASRDQMAAARIGYQSGETGFMDLIEAERNLRNVALGYEEALTNFHRHRAVMERVVGRIPGQSPEGDLR